MIKLELKVTSIGYIVTIIVYILLAKQLRLKESDKDYKQMRK